MSNHGKDCNCSICVVLRHSNATAATAEAYSKQIASMTARCECCFCKRRDAAETQYHQALDALYRRSADGAVENEIDALRARKEFAYWRWLSAGGERSTPIFSGQPGDEMLPPGWVGWRAEVSGRIKSLEVASAIAQKTPSRLRRKLIALLDRVPRPQLVAASVFAGMLLGLLAFRYWP